MLIGMLWFTENKKKGVLERVTSAKSYYEHKYGGTVNYCLLSAREYREADLAAVREDLAGIRFVLVNDVLPLHLIIGDKADCLETSKDDRSTK